MATIKEIAKLANCSIGTVSRVLNFDESLRVSEEKKALILKIAEEVQYKTISQRNQKTHYKIGVVSMYTTLEELEDPFYLSIRLGVEKRIQDEKIEIIVVNDTQGGYDLSKIKGVDGIIGIGFFSKTEIKAFAQISETMVFVNSDPNPAKYDSILFDGDNAVKEVIEYLTRKNHKKIGFIGVQETRDTKRIDLAEHRYELVQKYLEQKGIYEEKYIHHGGRTYHDGYRLMKQIIDTDELPTAFFIGNDSMCIGALTALYEAGIRVPTHMSLVGYNDITNAEFTFPPLTTVKVYTELMGEQAFEMLIDRIKGRVIPLKLITPTKLVIRNTVGKLEEETV